LSRCSHLDCRAAITLDEQGVRTKVQNGKMGSTGGIPFSRGGLYWLLSNPIYIGKLRHKDKLHEGQHDGIIPITLWDAVHAKLAASTAERRNAATGGSTALLTGMIRDALDRSMSPSFTVKQGRRYPYYVSSISKDIDRETRACKALPQTRIAARAIESATREAVRGLLHDEDAIIRLDPDASAILTRQRLDTAAELIRHVGPHAALGARMMFERLRLSIIIHPDRVEASLSREALIAILDHKNHQPEDTDTRLDLIIDTDLHRGKRGAKLVIASKSSDTKTVDPKLVTLIAKAHRARADLFSGVAPRGNRHIERLARLAYLAPDITAAILDGAQPKTLTSRKLLKLPALPLAWGEQRQMLGFTQARSG
jgi:hypothetical protein